MSASLRCAIYTRVSTDAGLEQEFNSLDAQRESAEAYIKSQAHEGWRLVREHFDDGGYSGGSMDRPALQNLLERVRERRIDVIVVYKVDRLTRSLADFAKLVEAFDAHGVAFVSVTQSFNTTTSMGRLTLNVLLSFAQFEREVTAERIRDKIAASKKKGLWMGGVVPLGYRVSERKLLVEEQEAALVRQIFALYLELGSVRALQSELRRRDIRSRVRRLASGRIIGGIHFTNGPLYRLLSNRIFLGEINHRGQSFPGEHVAIVDAEIFAQVQAKLDGQRLSRVDRLKSNALLTGKLFNEVGDRMSPTHANKQSVRYRYYISAAAMQGRERAVRAAHRLPAPALEAAIIAALRSAIGERTSKTNIEVEGIQPASGRAYLHKPIAGRPHQLSDASTLSSTAEAKSLIDAHLARAIVHSNRLEIEYRADLEDPHATETLFVPWAKPAMHVRRAILLPTSSDGQNRRMEGEERDRLLVAIVQARSWLEGLIKGTIPDLADIAATSGRTERSVRMTLSLAFLDPALVTAACSGTLPRGYGVTRLMELPPRFVDQWRALGLRRPT